MEKERYCCVHAKIKTHHSSVEEIEHLKCEAMRLFGCTGVEEYGLEEAEVDALLGERAFSGGELPWEIFEEVESSSQSKEELHYKFYFEGKDHLQEALRFTEYAGSKLKGAIVCEIREETAKDWNSEWKKFYAPIKVSPLIEIVPSFYDAEYKSDSLQTILINPGMGFGTGEHETTFLCLQFLSELSTHQGRCLDFGCGSGILGIAAGKLGFEDLVMCDLDENALANTLNNAELNQSHVELWRDKDEIKGSYHLIFANILMNILLQERDFLCSKLASKGQLILSGLLKDQTESVKMEFLKIPGLKLVKERTKGDWSALMFIKE